MFRRLRRVFLDLSDAFSQDADARGQILRQMRALAFAHFHQRGQRLLQGLFHDRPDVFGLDQFLVRLEHARRADHLVQRHFAGQLQLFGQAVEFGGVSLGERQIDVHARGQFALGGVDGNRAPSRVRARRGG